MNNSPTNKPPCVPLFPDTQTYFRGTIYAIDEAHREVLLENPIGARGIVQPKAWDTALLKTWFEDKRLVFATGMRAAGLPLLMLAEVRVSEEDGLW